MYVLRVKEVNEAEARAASYGLNEDVLIENAAAAIIERVLLHVTPKDKICVLVGGGNNGADGLSVARRLFLAGYKTEIVCTSEKSGAAATARLAACRELGVAEKSADEFCPDDYALAVDAMFGTGLCRPLEGKVRALVQKLNDSDLFTIAVDIPSGLCADTGETDCAVQADETVTFSFMKLGHVLGKGRNYCGNLVVSDIGLRYAGAVKAVTAADVKLPLRKAVSHKYDYGKVRIIAGSAEMIGASLLAHESASAALKSGAGLAALCVPASLKTVYQARVKEEMLCFLPDRDGKIIFDREKLDELFEKTNTILVGPGMGVNPELVKIICYIKDNFAGTLVLDADALNAFTGKAELLCEHKAKLILTPHTGEFERLAQGICSDTSVPMTERVRTLAARLHAVIAEKNATTVISDGNEVYLNTTGTPALAKGGSGDVLGGMIAAFACRLSPLKAALCGCYHFGKCAESAQKQYGTESLLASDVIIRIP